MNILDRIIADKKKEVLQRKEVTPSGILEKSDHMDRKAVSLLSLLRQAGNTGIIAEFKRMSPSAGVIHPNADPVIVAGEYLEAGASGLSILTDRKYFGGTAADLSRVRQACAGPILRKEFIIDEYQVIESKALGADVILLIASVLDQDQVRHLTDFAKSLGLEVLLEINRESELDRLDGSPDLAGVNNRDLATMKTTIQRSKTLAEKIPAEMVKISESGISSAETILELREYGFRGFLLGEYFMRSGDPGRACKELINDLRK